MADVMVKILMKGAKAIGKTAAILIMQKRDFHCMKISIIKVSGWYS